MHYWPNTKVYLATWCISYPLWLASGTFLGTESIITGILILLNILIGIGALVGLALSKGLGAISYQAALPAFFFPIQPFFVLFYMLIPARPGSDFSHKGDNVLIHLVTWVAFVLCLIVSMKMYFSSLIN